MGARDAALHRDGSAGPWSEGDVILSADGPGSVNGIDPDIAWDADGNVYITYSGLILSGPDWAPTSASCR